MIIYSQLVWWVVGLWCPCTSRCFAFAFDFGWLYGGGARAGGGERTQSVRIGDYSTWREEWRVALAQLLLSAGIVTGQTNLLFTVKNHTFTLLLPQIALTHVSFLHNLVGCLALFVPDTTISLRTHNHGLIINIRHLIRNHLHLIFTEEDT